MFITACALARATRPRTVAIFRIISMQYSGQVLWEKTYQEYWPSPYKLAQGGGPVSVLRKAERRAVGPVPDPQVRAARLL